LILGAAAHVFAKEGFAGATVDQIVARIRMSRRTFYEHFDDLRDVLVALYDYGARLLFDAVQEAIRRDDPPVQRLWNGIVAYLTAMREMAPLARVLYQEARATGPLRQELARQRYVTMWRDGFIKSFEAGQGRRIPDEVQVYALTAGIEAVALRYIERGEEHLILEAAPALATMVISMTLGTEAELRAIVGDVIPKHTP
jgi:AcrR family transcriptional regulator